MSDLHGILNSAIGTAWSWPALSGAVLLLGVFHILGCLLAPATVASRRTLPGLAVVWASGMLFTTGAAAVLALHRFSFFTVVPVIQIALAVLWRCKLRSDAAVSQTAGDRWSAAEVVKALLVIAGFVLLFSIPFGFASGNGRIRGPHPDMGYYAQQVLGIPEAGAASLWSGALGPLCEAAGEARDVWYHWGPVMLAIGVRSASAMPAFDALLGVARFALDGVLVIAAGAVASCICGGASRIRSLVFGGLALLVIDLLKLHGLLTWLRSSAPDLIDHQVRYSLAVFFNYKHEGALVLAALAAWLSGKKSIAAFFVFASAVSAPHSFAGLGCAAGGAMIAGLLMRRPDVWRPSLAATGLLLLGMAAAVLFGAEMPKSSDTSFLAFDWRRLGGMLAGGLRDSLIGFAISAVMLPGIIHLLRGKSGDDEGRLRLLGIMMLCGLAASWFAYHLSAAMDDRVHIVLFIQTMLVMPVGWLATIRAFQDSSGLKRHAALACATAAIAMGAHDLILPTLTEAELPCKRNDLKVIRDELDGRPFGYFAEHDRGWWIPIQSSLASHMDVRCIRLNPLFDRRDRSSPFYGSTAPFQLTPPQPDETPSQWALRFAGDLGIKHVVSTTKHPIPKTIKPLCRAVATGPGIILYELPAPNKAEARPLAQPSAQAAKNETDERASLEESRP